MNKKERRPLTIPRVAWNQKSLSDTIGELIAEPLDPGFGVTFGNALRRILLSSIEGSAVTSVIIKGINNEFSTLSGVVEDALEVTLNIKDIIISNATGEPGMMRMIVEGEGTARVADIVADPHLTLLNKDHIIAHVAEGGILDIQFFVESGRGYQAAQWPTRHALQADDRVYLDTKFSPVLRTTFAVHKVRVGRDIDYDQLVLSVVTNGAEKPLDCVHYAVSVLRTQLEHFLTDAEIPFNDISAPAREVVSGYTASSQEGLSGQPATELLLKPIDALEFSVRANNCLLKAGIKRIIDLVNLTEEDAMNIKHFGRKSFEEVKEGMKVFGLTFGMNVNEETIKRNLRSTKKD